MEFDKVWALLEPAAELGDISQSEVIDGLSRGEYILFGNETSAALAAPMGNTLRIGLAGGDLEELQQVEIEIDLYARRIGFERIEIVGRDGWLKTLPGYKKAAVVLRKELV